MRFVLSLVSVVETLALPSPVMQILNSTLHSHEVSLSLGIYSSKVLTWSPNSVPELFSNVNLNSPIFDFEALSTFCPNLWKPEFLSS